MRDLSAGSWLVVIGLTLMSLGPIILLAGLVLKFTFFRPWL